MSYVADTIGTAHHRAGSKLDYSLDWSKWLEVGDKVQTSEWSVTDGCSISDPQINSEGTKTSVYVDGGLPGRTSYLTNTITTLKLKDSRTIKLIHPCTT